MTNKLDIILVTYNRKSKCEYTLNAILSDSSPIRDYDITILDNKSTDGTTEMISEYAGKYHNIKHIVNNRNIGGNANIAKAFEIANKEYVWVLCDDDEYDFTHWEEVECAIDKEHDLIVVSNYASPQDSLGAMFKQLSFVPAGIFKTSNITDDVMFNIEYNQSNMFPHLAVTAAIINNNGSIHICQNWTVKMVQNPDASYSRGLLNSHVHPHWNAAGWPFAYSNTLLLINNINMRKQIFRYINHPNKYSFFSYIYENLYYNDHFCHSEKRNLIEFYKLLNFNEKVFFHFVRTFRKCINWLLDFNYDRVSGRMYILVIKKIKINFKLNKSR